MPTPSIEEIIQNQAFSTNISIVGVNGLMGFEQNFIFDFSVLSKPFNLNNINYRVKSSIRGTLKILNPTESFSCRFNVDDDEVKKENISRINNLFNPNSEHFAFDKAELIDFFEGLHQLYFVRNDHSPLLSKIPLIPLNTQNMVLKTLKTYLKNLEMDFYSDNINEIKEFVKHLPV